MKAKRECSLSTPHVCFTFNAQINVRALLTCKYMKRLARKHKYGGWIEIARFQLNYKYIYRERGVQENRVFLNTACTLMCERVHVCVCENIK